jgi:hypothetical protein
MLENYPNIALLHKAFEENGVEGFSLINGHADSKLATWKSFGGFSLTLNPSKSEVVLDLGDGWFDDLKANLSAFTADELAVIDAACKEELEEVGGTEEP